jgi:hypothetical protein
MSTTIETEHPLPIPRPPLLLFHAYTINTTNFGLANPDVDIQYSGHVNLYFGHKQCRRLFKEFETFKGLRSGLGTDFVLLSCMPGGRDSTYNMWFDKDAFENKGWFICNVMLVEWKEHWA